MKSTVINNAYVMFDTFSYTRILAPVYSLIFVRV